MIVNRYNNAFNSLNRVYNDLLLDGYEFDYDGFVYWLTCHGWPIDKYAEYALAEMHRFGYFKK